MLVVTANYSTPAVVTNVITCLSCSLRFEVLACNNIDCRICFGTLVKISSFGGDCLHLLLADVGGVATVRGLRAANRGESFFTILKARVPFHCCKWITKQQPESILT